MEYNCTLPPCDYRTLSWGFYGNPAAFKNICSSHQQKRLKKLIATWPALPLRGGCLLVCPLAPGLSLPSAWCLLCNRLKQQLNSSSHLRTPALETCTRIPPVPRRWNSGTTYMAFQCWRSPTPATSIPTWQLNSVLSLGKAWRTLRSHLSASLHFFGTRACKAPYLHSQTGMAASLPTHCLCQNTQTDPAESATGKGHPQNPPGSQCSLLLTAPLAARVCHNNGFQARTHPGSTSPGALNQSK